MNTAVRPSVIVHCSLTDIANDPRILRQVNAHREMGHTVVTQDRISGLPVRTMTNAEKLRRAALQIPTWVMPQNLVVQGQLAGAVNRALHSGLKNWEPSLIHVHNPELLPAVAKYAKQTGTPWVYDAHEYAQAERWESLPWRLTFPAYIRALEQQCAPTASSVTCVSDTLAGYLFDELKLKLRPVVLRNVPDAVPLPPSPTNSNRILLHYHGLLNSGRNIEQLITVLSHLPDQFFLRITGPVAQPNYDRQIIDHARNLNVTKRVILHGPVDNKLLTEHASEADIGIFLFDAKTPQQRCALPNKIFEYAQAGLMVIAGSGPEMLSSVNENRNGISVSDTDPSIVASQIENLSTGEIDSFKAKSHESAKTDHWSVEKSILTDLTTQLLFP